MTYNDEGKKAACYSLVYDTISIQVPVMYLLGCLRSGEWEKVTIPQFKEYITKYPPARAEQVMYTSNDEAACPCGECE